jgi:hypothetical protein
MNCHMCASLGQEGEATVVCNECGGAVCQEHLEDAIIANRRDRLHLPQCSHALVPPDSGHREETRARSTPSMPTFPRTGSRPHPGIRN